MTDLSPHFSLSEMTVTKTGLPNEPDPAQLANLSHTATCMEAVRTLLGTPVLVSSGFRSPAVNKAVGGVPNDAHELGDACDFESPAFGPPMLIAKKIQASGMKFDQLIREGGDHAGNGGWVHISFDPRLRQQALTAVFVDGHATYQTGINR